MKYTFKEVCRSLDVPRTTAQYWVEKILEWPKSSNTATLYFDEETYEKMWEIKFYVETGHKIKDIPQLLANKSNKQERLQQLLIKLQEKRDKLNKYIDIVTVLKDTGVGPNNIRFGIPLFEDATFEEVSDFIEAISDMENAEFQIDDEKFEQCIEQFAERIDELADMYKEYGYLSQEVQQKVKETFSDLTPFIPLSSFAYNWMVVLLESDEEWVSQIDEEHNAGCSNFIFNAIRHYCNTNLSISLEDMVGDIAEEILALGKKKYSSKSKEVQEKVKQLSQCLLEAYEADSNDEKQLLIRQIAGYSNPKYATYIDKTCGRGASKYLINALHFYYKQL